MQICRAIKFLRIAAMPATSILVGVPAFVSALAQTAPSAAPAAAPIQLQTYTASDQSASAGVPAGWKVASATGTNIELSGPQGEVIALGEGYIAHNGPFQVGQKGPNGSNMTMPYSAKPTDKLTMVFQQRAALNGNPPPQIKFLYAAPLQVPAAMGQCGMFVIGVSGIATPGDAMGVFCSLPEDSAQFFKNFLMYGGAPTAVAARDVPTVEAVLKSYKIPAAWMQKKFAPFTAPAVAVPAPAAGPGGAYQTQMFLNEIWNNSSALNVGFACADANIIGTPNRQVANECGGWEPSF